MNEKLNNIFVPVEVAKLAKEKGFNEKCVAIIHYPEDNEICYKSVSDWQSRFCTHRNSEVKKNIMVPAHLQLIKWLKDNHNIDVQMQHNGLWDVQNKEGDYADLGLEINEALTVGLNLIKPTS